MSSLLLINAAVKTPFVAIVQNGKTVSIQTATQERAFSQEGMGLLEKALRVGGVTLKDLAGGIFVIGPGSFTGIRIGLSLLKGLFFRQIFPVVSLSSLYLLARPFFNRGASVCPVMDAKMGQLYGAWYGHSGEERVAPIAENPELFAQRMDGKIILVGEGAALFRSHLEVRTAIQMVGVENPSFEEFVESAAQAGWENFQRGETSPIADLRPLYLRLSYAEVKRERESASS